MIDWVARARAQLDQQRHVGTAKTDETRLLSVSSAPPGGHTPDCERLSSVSSVATPVVATTRTGAVDTISLMAANDANTGTPPLVRSSGNPYMTPDQGDECHACGWNDAEIDLFMSRAAKFAMLGRADAEHLAERLTLRDRQADDRGMCVECREFEVTGRCAAARRGAIHGADRRLEPVQNILMRCSTFDGAVSTHRNHRG